MHPPGFAVPSVTTQQIEPKATFVYSWLSKRNVQLSFAGNLIVALRVFRLLLVLILVLQSLIAVADVHQLHQQTPMHQSLTAGESINHIAIAASRSVDGVGNGDVTQDPSKTYDVQCSHCCHCHGTMPILAGHASHIPTLDSASPVPEHFATISSWFSSPDFRPPIV